MLETVEQDKDAKRDDAGDRTPRQSGADRLRLQAPSASMRHSSPWQRHRRTDRRDPRRQCARPRKRRRKRCCRRLHRPADADGKPASATWRTASARSPGLRDPVGEVISEWDRPNGLHIERVRTPLGVIGVIYESRPNRHGGCRRALPQGRQCGDPARRIRQLSTRRGRSMPA